MTPAACASVAILTKIGRTVEAGPLTRRVFNWRSAPTAARRSVFRGSAVQARCRWISQNAGFARHVGRVKYAIVLSGEPDEVVGWGYDEESAIKVAQALNFAERP